MERNFPILADSMRKLFLVLGVVVCYLGQCQYLDLAKIEYTYLPGNDANFEYQRQRVLFNIPIKLNEKAYFFAGLDYSNIQFRFDEDQDSYDKSEAENFKSLDLALAYIYELKNDWYLGVQISPSFTSNLEGSLIRRDLLVSGIVVFVKDKIDPNKAKKPHRIIAGLYYATTTRFPAPFPFFSYYRKFHEKWSYTIGAPSSNLKYYFDQKHRIQLYAEGDGFNTNLQNGVLINDNAFADRIRMLLILTGVRYEYSISKHFEAYINATRTVFSDVQLRDGKENVFIPAIDNAMLYRIGIRCKI
ncbi:MULTISPECIES: DUF6268 family outer membrane beta-barrel protein [unclassified Ekhidna]|uniref:DUF6268 family outer membrane beta-barrel protein n=1 Tax=unclassified Ekhidna TaxID=2632188 RepID=UPI0032DFB569